MMEASSPRGLSNLLPVLLGGTTVGAAVLFFMGWEYQRSYVETLSLPASAFSYAPYELMASSSLFLLGSASLLLGFLAGDAISSYTKVAFPSDPATIEAVQLTLRRYRAVSLLLLSGAAVAWVVHVLLSRDWVALNGTFLIGLFALAYIGLSLVRRGHDHARFLILAAVIVGLPILLTAFPRSLGQRDARRDLNDRGRLPRVELQLRYGIKLSPAGNCGDAGPWRVLRVNDGRYWLLLDDPADKTVTAVEQSNVTSVTYLDKTGSSTPCKAP